MTIVIKFTLQGLSARIVSGKDKLKDRPRSIHPAEVNLREPSYSSLNHIP